MTNAETGKVHAKSTSCTKAAKQEKLLNAIDHGYDVKKRKSANPGEHIDHKVKGFKTQMCPITGETQDTEMEEQGQRD